MDWVRKLCWIGGRNVRSYSIGKSSALRVGCMNIDRIILKWFSQETGWECVNWIHLAQNKQAEAFLNIAIKLGFRETWTIPQSTVEISPSHEGLCHVLSVYLRVVE
jgi:hypothetical protein